MTSMDYVDKARAIIAKAEELQAADERNKRRAIGLSHVTTLAEVHDLTGTAVGSMRTVLLREKPWWARKQHGTWLVLRQEAVDRFGRVE